MSSAVTVLDFDHTYSTQPVLRKQNVEWIKLFDIQHCNRFCEMNSLSLIRKRIQKRMKKRITLIGSGNYHYVTYLLLSEIKEPFTLVLFDHHTDMIQSPCDTLISCGSWVLDAMKLSKLKRVVLIGVNKEWKHQVPSSQLKNITVYPEQDLNRASSASSTVLSEIPSENVYISIDKDVLDPQDAVTGWDQGDMKLPYLIEIIHRIAANKHILGLDICGEYPFSPTGAYQRNIKKSYFKNEQANRFILERVKEWV